MPKHVFMTNSYGCGRCYWYLNDLPTDCPVLGGAQVQMIRDVQRCLGLNMYALRRAGFDYRDGYGWYQKLEGGDAEA